CAAHFPCGQSRPMANAGRPPLPQRANHSTARCSSACAVWGTCGRVPTMTPVQSRRTYFLFAHIVLCGVVFVAFAPTYFLRGLVPQPPILDLPTLPSLFHVHGVILFAWYAFLVVQPVLVRSGSLAIH